MLASIFPPPQDLIKTDQDGTTLYARNSIVGVMTFCTLGFLVFILLEFREVSTRIRTEFWVAAFAFGFLAIYLGFSKLRDTRPLMWVGAEGIAFPRQFSDIIPWDYISEIKFLGTMMTVTFNRDLRLHWFPKFTLIPGDPGRAGDGFFSQHEVPWVRIRINYLWPMSRAGVRQVIDKNRKS